MFHVFGQHDQKTLEQFEKSTRHPAFYAGALMADGHIGHGYPIGGVSAYFDHINMHGVGADVSCGNKAVKLNVKGSAFTEADWKLLADDMQKNIAFGVGKSACHQQDHEMFDDPWFTKQLIPGIKDKARNQIGSCGSSNHFLNLFLDEDDFVWIGVHFGSRGVGASIAKYFMQAAGGKDGIDADPVIISTKSDLGQEYVDALRLAGRFAYAGRDIVCDYVAKHIIKADIIDSVHQNHNFTWLETHNGNEVWVTRKGSTPAFPGDRMFVGASMGGNSVILQAKFEDDLSKQTLCSTVHGAGRLLSRTQASGKTKWIRNAEGVKRPTKVSEGLINESAMRAAIAAAGIELRGGGADEAPDVYRQLPDVLKYHEGTVKVERWLRPKVVVMAGSTDGEI